jgi:lipase chaperone LimK
VIIGEFVSTELEELLDREETVKTRFEPYCRQHSKVLTTSYEISKVNKIIYTLKFKIENNEYIR